MVSVDSAYIEGVREWLLAAIAKHIADISSGDQLVGNFCCAEEAVMRPPVAKCPSTRRGNVSSAPASGRIFGVSQSTRSRGQVSTCPRRGKPVIL